MSDKIQTDDINIKMVGLDLDGTVLNRQCLLTDGVAEAMEKAMAAGIVVVPVTGRPLSGIPHSILSLKGLRFAITSNGAVTTDLTKGEVIESHFLSAENAQKAAEYASDINYIYSVFINGTGYSEVDAHNNLTDFFAETPLRSYVEKSRKPVESIMGFLDFQSEVKFSDGSSGRLNRDCVENIWIRCRDGAEGDEAERVLRENAPTTIIHRMIPEDVEMVAADADKGDAFLNLAASLGIKREETMAVGDSVNDLELMKKAGLSVAMGNAVESIKKVCDYTTEDNEHDGVARAIEKFCKGVLK